MIDDEHRKIARFYDAVYHRDASASDQPSQHLVRLAKRFSPASGKKALDIGCGTGAWLQVLSDNGADVCGIDISERAIEAARRRLPQAGLHVGPAETLPYEDDSFDIVTCLGSLEHFLDQPMALREMARVARPDGRILVLVPNAGFLTYRLGLYRGTQQQEARETIRSLNEWSRFFSEAGIEIIERWKDLHILDRKWITRKPRYLIPARLLQALLLAVWPLGWQYQVYHLGCATKSDSLSDSLRADPAPLKSRHGARSI